MKKIIFAPANQIFASNRPTVQPVQLIQPLSNHFNLLKLNIYNTFFYQLDWLDRLDTLSPFRPKKSKWQFIISPVLFKINFALLFSLPFFHLHGVKKLFTPIIFEHIARKF